MKTLELFNQVRAVPRAVQPGRMTLHAAAELMDAMLALCILCKLTLAEHLEHRPDLAAKCGQLVRPMTLAGALRVLRDWHRWTHQFHGGQVPDKLAVQSFLGTLG